MVLVLRESGAGSAGEGLTGPRSRGRSDRGGHARGRDRHPILLAGGGASRTITGALLAAMVVQLLFVTLLTQTALLSLLLLLGLAGQIVKLSGDAAMQIEIDDARRGQVFALQDTVFRLPHRDRRRRRRRARRTAALPAVAGVGIYLAGLVGVLAVRRLRM